MDSEAPLRVLVTGSEGFIGSQVVRELERRGHTTVGYDLKKKQDVRDAKKLAKAMKGCDAVAHLAALCIGTESLDDPEPYFETNVIGTFNALKAAKELGIRRFVYAGSAAALSPYETPYGLTKLQGEEWCLMYHARHGLDARVLRFFNVYGPGDNKGVLFSFIPRVRAGQEVTVFGDGEQTRDFVHVYDVAATVADFCEKELPWQPSYEVGSGKETTVKDLIKLLGKVMGTAPKVRYAEPRIGDVRFSRSSKPWLKPRIGLEEGLRITVGEPWQPRL